MLVQDYGGIRLDKAHMLSTTCIILAPIVKVQE